MENRARHLSGQSLPSLLFSRSIVVFPAYTWIRSPFSKTQITPFFFFAAFVIASQRIFGALLFCYRYASPASLGSAPFGGEFFSSYSPVLFLFGM